MTIGSRLGSIDLLQNEFLKSRFLKKDINKLELFHLTREYYEFVKDGIHILLISKVHTQQKGGLNLHME